VARVLQNRHTRRARGNGALALVGALAIVASAIGVVPAVAGSGAQSKPPTVVQAAATIDPALDALLGRLDPDDTLPVIVVLRDQLNARAVRRVSGERAGATLIRALKAKAEGTQGQLRAILGRARADGQASAATPLWIVNGIAITARPGLIRRLAARPEVASIVPDHSIAAPAPPAGATIAAVVEPNIALVNAPALWDLGFRGAGVVVASMDTGVDAGHPDLAGAYRGGSDSWFDPYEQHALPTDLNGHGTMTAGVMVGGAAGGTAIGVAPEASWIAARIFNDSGVATSTAIHLAFQWLMDPDGDPATPDAPDIVNGSWAMSSPGCNLEFEPDLQALVAAGIEPVFAAGNYGPSADTTSSPGNNPEAFAVGAIDNAGAIASVSSRGPTSCGRLSPAIVPAVVAPGVAIVTTDKNGLYASASGTSLAAPHVSGGLALLKSAYPDLPVAMLEAALTASAVDLGDVGADNTFGAGRIDLLAAYDYLGGATPPPPPSPSPSSDPAPSASSAPPSDAAGPQAGLPVVAPNPANGATAVAISVIIDDAGTGGSAIAAAEWFVDVAGAAGTGHALNGTFTTSQVVVSGSVATSDLAGLAAGAHQILVRGRDSAGNWGPTSSAALVIDRAGPTASAISVSSDPTQGAATLTLTASLEDAASVLARGEWFIGADPGPGAGVAMIASDGAFDTTTETLTTSIPLGGRPFGETVVSLRGRDTAGNWGPVSTRTVTNSPSDGLFADGFETGTTAHWSGRTGTTRLAVTASAAMAGRWGLTISIAAGRHAYLTDTTPLAATGYHARFGFDARALSTSNRAIDIFTGRNTAGTTILRLQYRRAAGHAGQVRLGALRAGGTTWSSWISLTSGRHSIELGWRSGTSTTLRLWIDGVARASRTGLDTHRYRLDSVRLGPSAGLTSSMAGKLQFDRFVSSRGSTIGR
jgi:subtilisin family serine protease